MGNDTWEVQSHDVTLKGESQGHLHIDWLGDLYAIYITLYMYTFVTIFFFYWTSPALALGVL